VFRRRRATDDELAEGESREEAEDSAAAEPAVAAPPRPQGPWDAQDVPADGRARVDLGSLLVPVPAGVEARVDMQEEHVMAATLVDGRSLMQMHAFAAPKSRGIWDEVRAEIVHSLRGAGGEAEEVDGPFGRELRARIPADVPGQGRVLQPARFIGVDGPRWFLRGLVTGPAATDPSQARRLEDVVRDTVVVRGTEAMAPRDMLPLKLPREAAAARQAALEAAGQAQPEPSGKPTLEMLERGPEITETR
jgi:hypothetical protein